METRLSQRLNKGRPPQRYGWAELNERLKRLQRQTEEGLTQREEGEVLQRLNDTVVAVSAQLGELGCDRADFPDEENELDPENLLVDTAACTAHGHPPEMETAEEYLQSFTDDPRVATSTPSTDQTERKRKLRGSAHFQTSMDDTSSVTTSRSKGVGDMYAEADTHATNRSEFDPSGLVCETKQRTHVRQDMYVGLHEQDGHDIDVQHVQRPTTRIAGSVRSEGRQRAPTEASRSKSRSSTPATRVEEPKGDDSSGSAMLQAILQRMNERDRVLEEQIEGLTRQISALKTKRSVDEESERQTDTSSTERTAISQLAEAIGGALASQAPKSTDNSEELKRLVARQALASKELPVFAGEPEDWPVFIEQFRSSTKECQFTEAENMARLRKALKGKARDTVSGLLSLPGNLTQVISTLERRFGRPDFIIQTLIEKTKQMATPREGDMVGLIDFSNAVSNLVSTMELLKSDGHLTNPDLRQLLIDRLPSSLRLRWGEKANAAAPGHVNLRDFAQWLAARADAASLVTTPAARRDTEYRPPASERPRAKASDTKAREAPKSGSGLHSTTQCFTITCDEAEQQLRALPVKDRMAFAQQHRLCWNCLRQHHRASKCRARGRCSRCQRKHHGVMHDALDTSSTRRNPAGSAQGNGEQQQQRQQQRQQGEIRSYGCHAASRQPPVQLMTAVAEVQGCSLRAKVRVFLDMGSQASFVTTALVKAVKPQHLGTDDVTIATFGNKTVTRMERYEIALTTIEGKKLHLAAWQREELPLNIRSVPQEACVRWRESGILFSDSENNQAAPHEIHVLLGADVVSELLISKREMDGETAWDTKIGWVLAGRIKEEETAGPRKCRAEVACISISPSPKGWDDRISCLWEMEEPALLDRTHCHPAFPLTKHSNGYEIGLLWKNEQRPADNRNQALACTMRLLQKLERQEKRCAYDDVLLQEYVQLEAVEREPQPSTPGYYLPHHAVERAGATTTKLRVVFNASAAPKGQKSLNDTIDPGPSLMPDLTGLLLRFREYSAAVQADIRKAFFMIGVQEEDRPYLRYLWPDADGVMTTWRLRKLPFGVNCSPFILSAVLQHHLVAEGTSRPDERDLIDLLKRSLYVDDCLTSVPTAVEANHFRSVSTECLGTAEMDLRKWRGNTLEDDAEAGEKVLGLLWDTASDQLQLVRPAFQPTDGHTWTRRSLLQAVAATFDPLGIVSPVLVTGKILLQQAWKVTRTWDEELPSDLSARVVRWWGEVQKLVEFKVPRWIGAYPMESVTAHVFADASEAAYACCVYLVTASRSELIFAKAKVAPPSAPTLPRLELQAAFMAARRVRAVIEELRVSVSQVVGWTDSITTLQWILGEAWRWQTFVRNRVVAIQEVSQSLKLGWRHCPGADNPADQPTRGVELARLEGTAWRHGPHWLSDPDMWPAVVGEEDLKEMEPLEVRVSVVEVPFANQPWWTRVSTWSRLLGVVRCMMKWRYRSRQPAELRFKAEMVLFRIAQAEHFSEEIALIGHSAPVPTSSKVYQLRPTVDEHGVLRVGGRLAYSDLPSDAKHPILLPKHHISQLLLQHLHAQSMHMGVETVLALSRERFWILGARRTLRKIKSSCVLCRRFDARPGDEAAAPLPQDRVVFSAPFQVCGVDYAGPLLVRSGTEVVKRWIAIFVCAITRAVYLDLVLTLALADFLLAWRRFVARYGVPHRVRSDNGTTFVAAAKALPAVEWIFNPPSAPWFGGFYERLVGVVKRPLKKVLGKALVTHEELSTLLCEVECAVNRRPLTHVGSLEDDAPLTPAALLGQSWSYSGQPLPCGDAELDKRSMIRRVRYCATLRRHLEDRWKTDYLQSLQGYHAGKSTPIAVGDVVLLVDDRQGRQLWRPARVCQLYEGRDGRQRVARVSVGGKSTMLRPIRRLIPLEVTHPDKADDSDGRAPVEVTADKTTHATEEPTDQDTALRRTRTRIVRRPERLNL